MLGCAANIVDLIWKAVLFDWCGFLHSRSRAGGCGKEVAKDTDVAMGMVF